MNILQLPTLLDKAAGLMKDINDAEDNKSE